MYGLSTLSHSAQSYRCFTKYSVLDSYIRKKEKFSGKYSKKLYLKPKKGNLLVKTEKNGNGLKIVKKTRNFLEKTEIAILKNGICLEKNPRKIDGST